MQLGLAWRLLGLQVTAVGLNVLQSVQLLVCEMLTVEYLSTGLRCVRSGVAVILGSSKMLLSDYL